MENNEMLALKGMELAPWIQKSTTLIEHQRKVGGNQFRHCLATMTILMDYHFIDSVILKTAIVHDLLEDSGKVSAQELADIDKDGPEVVGLVQELTRNKNLESKSEYLLNLLMNGSIKAKIVKLADRISNLTDLHLFVFNEKETESYIHETELYIMPIVDQLLRSGLPEEQKNMVREMGKELKDLIVIRHMYVKEFIRDESIRLKIKKMLQSFAHRNTKP
ncbi:MAG: HD domain-containing protein [Bacteroidales bacterium]|nr:HD domain-containing protein [Bacteroidales bacterium]